ncbi:MAG: hypothetical protein ACF788_08765 [Novipirellula sp. JB048]
MIHYAKDGNLLGMPTPNGYDRGYFDDDGQPPLFSVSRSAAQHETFRRAQQSQPASGRRRVTTQSEGVGGSGGANYHATVVVNPILPSLQP